MLTASQGLPPPERVLATAREVELRDHAVVVYLADPFDILANKLTIHRAKDEPHIEVLRCFVEQELITDFASEKPGRARLEAARRFLDVTGAAELPQDLAERLIPFADNEATRRFLAAHAPRADQVRRIIATAPEGSERGVLMRIAASRDIE